MLLFSAVWVTTAQVSDNAAAERYIIESEKQWDVSNTNRDTGIVERVLAEDCMGVAPDASFCNKAQAVQETREHKGEFISNHVNSVKVRCHAGKRNVGEGT
jgi:hypothetical protein